MLTAAILLVSAIAQPADHQRARLLAEYRLINNELRAKSPASSSTLNRAWTIAGEWTALYLNAHPKALASDIAGAIEELDRSVPRDGDYHLTANAIRLGDAWAVSASYARAGTFFVVAPEADRKFAVRWSIKKAASNDEMRAWTSNTFSWGDGPLVGRVGHLATSRSGKARFYVEAHAAALAGGTFRHQISVWEWDGHEAAPLLIQSYAASFDTPPITVADGSITVHAKGEYKSLSTCGACPEPEIVWLILVRPDAVTKTSPAFADRELKAFDDLWDSIIHHRPTQNIASPAVAAELRRLAACLSSSEPDRSRLLGMLMNHTVTKAGSRRVLELSTDNLPGGPIRFDIVQRNGGLYFENVHAAHCE